MTSIITELRRRNVFRVAAVYAVTGWLIAQAAVVLEGTLNLPDWFDTIIVVTLLLGFPVAMILAWAFELTPDGFKPTTRVDETGIHDKVKKRSLNIALGTALASAVAFIAFDTLVLDRRAPVESAEAPAPAPAPAPGASIAVLPFADMSSAGDQVYFGDGIAEELLNVLAKVDGLRVASRTSAFTFRERTASVAELADALDVAHILEGSVRKAGDQVRITAQLIRTENDEHLWSETYDRALTAENLFAIQDEIAAAIIAEVGDRLELGAQDRPTTDTRAYELYLSGRARIERRTRDAVLTGMDELKQAVAIDPDFAEARVALARAHLLSGNYAGLGVDNVAPRALAELDAAEALDPDVSGLHLQRAWVSYVTRDFDEEALLERFREAVRRDPDNADAHRGVAVVLRRLGRTDEMDAAMARALELDPRSTITLINAASSDLDAGRMAAGEEKLRRILAIDPGFAIAAERITELLFNRGEVREAHRVSMWKPDEPAIQWMRRAVYRYVGAWDQLEALDPLQGSAYRALARGDQDAALRYTWLLHESEARPPWGLADALGDAALQREMLEAEDATLAFLRGDGDFFYGAVPPAMMFLRAFGDAEPDAAARVEARLEAFFAQRGPGEFWNPDEDMARARYHAQRGETDAMLAALESLVARRYPAADLKFHVDFDPYRDTPEFQAWAERMEAVAAEARAAILADLADPPDPWWDPEAL